MNLLRRKLVKSAVFVGTTASLVGTGVLLPQRVLGAYATEAFAARDVDGALIGSLGSAEHSASDSVKLKAPDIAENGGRGACYGFRQPGQCRCHIYRRRG